MSYPHSNTMSKGHNCNKIDNLIIDKFQEKLTAVLNSCDTVSLQFEELEQEDFGKIIDEFNKYLIKAKTKEHSQTRNKSIRIKKTPALPPPEPSSLCIIFQSIVEEIKCNASIEVAHMRYKMASTICRWLKQKKIDSIEAGKKLMYKKYNIHVNYDSTKKLNVTTEETMGKDIEYNEVLGKYVYGWDLNGDCVYEPTIGISIIPPEYMNAGYEWRQVLDHRYSKLDPSERLCALERYTGN